MSSFLAVKRNLKQQPITLETEGHVGFVALYDTAVYISVLWWNKLVIFQFIRAEILSVIRFI